MRTYKKVLAIFSLLVVIGIYLTMESISPGEEATETPSYQIQDCYQAALDCKEDETKCSLCGSYCTDMKGNPVKENAVQYCRLGKANKIINKSNSDNSTD